MQTMNKNELNYLFQKATELKECRQFDSAIEILQMIVDNSDGLPNDFMTGVYNTLGSCYYEKSLSSGDIILRNREIKKAESNIKKALDLKPMNMTAVENLFGVYLQNRDYYGCCELIAKYDLYDSRRYKSDDPFFVKTLEVFPEIIRKEIKKSEEFFNSIYELHSKYRDSYAYSHFLFTYSFMLGFKNKSLMLIMDCFNPEYYQSLSKDYQLALYSERLFTETGISDRKELTGSVKEADDFYKKNKDSFSVEMKAIYAGNRVGALAKIGAPIDDDFWEISKEIPNEYRDNTYYYNLAKAFLQYGDYDEAIRLGNAAIMTKSDDQDMTLLGRAYMGLGDYTEAIEWFKKALGFILDGKEDDYTLGDFRVESFTSESINERNSDVYKYLIQAYFANKEYDFAQAVLMKYKEAGYPEDTIDSEMILRIESEIAGEKDEIQSAYDELTTELEKEKAETSILKRNALDWYKKLLDCQLVDDKETVDDEEWESHHSEKMDKAIKSIIVYCGNKDSKNYQNITSLIDKRFPKLEKTSRNFLATAEQIYTEFEDNKFIDFAPVMVEYSRFIETLLWRYINNSQEYKLSGQKAKEFNNQGETLGAATYVAGRRGGSLFKYHEKLQWIKDNRNRSAHINVSREPEVSGIRKFLWESDIVDTLCDIL